MTDFAGRLRAARLLNGATQAEVARAANLPPSAVAHFESGSRKPSFENLRRLAAALGFTSDYLLGLPPSEMTFRMPKPQWLLEFAQRWSSAKDENSVKALAWNINGAFNEWLDLETAPSTGSQPQPTAPQSAANGDSGRSSNPPPIGRGA